MPSTKLTNRVGIAGITGKLGRLITQELLSYDHVEVHGVARNPGKLPDELKSNERVKLFKSDMTDVEELREAFRGCSIVLSTVLILNHPDEEKLQKNMIDACIAEGVPRFMPNDFTFDWRCADLDLIPQKRVVQALYDYIDERSDKITGVHVLIGAFMETLFSADYWFDASKNPAEGLRSWGTGDEIWEMTSYGNAAQYTAAVALDPEATGFLRFLGDRLSLKEVCQTLQEGYDLPPVPFTSLGSQADLRAIVERGIKENPQSPNFWDWMGQSYTLMLTNGQTYLETPLNNSMYIDTVQQESLEYWLQERKLEELSKSMWF